MAKLLSYLKYRLVLIIFYIVAVMLVLTVSSLAGQDMVYARYTVLLLSFFLLIIMLADGMRYMRQRRRLEALSTELYHATRELPEPMNVLEADYVRLLGDLGHAYDTLRKRLETAQNDSIEYYTLWVHQIKTPIAALGLVLSQMDGESVGVIRQELFKIERYADLALRYIKLADISADLVIERCRLGDIVHEGVKKFGVLFVYQRLSIDIAPIDVEVMSDKRWLAFIFEQILSNALKYTPMGGVRVYMQGRTLVIEDSGIGIRPEDLPRIFTKGYTGYNGRLDNRASGIGLYLAKKAADALGVRITAESQVGKGTRMSLPFPETDMDIFR
jgi:signal transduction histidine kinase